MEKEKILVTGGNGFIGSHICTKLVDLGYDVIVVCRKPKSQNILFNDYLDNGRISLIQGDIKDFDYSKIPNVDYIIHLACKSDLFGDIEDFKQINVEATFKLLKFAKSCVNLKCFAYISTTAVYGFDGYVDLKEDAPKMPFKNLYPMTKLEAEQLIYEFCTNNSMKYLILRPGNVYGEYDYNSSFKICSKIKNKKMCICAGGKYKNCFIYVGNLVNSIIHLLQNPTYYNTDYNLTDGNKESLKYYLINIAKHFEVKPFFINFPSPIAKMIANFVEGFYKLFKCKKTPTITKFLVCQNCVDYHFSVDKLMSTGYQKEFSFDDGIKRTVDWFNSIDVSSKK